jgi:site-specific recombinase XerD
MPQNPLTQRYLLFLQMFLTDCQARNLRPATLTFYCQELTRFLAHSTETGCKMLEDITPYMIRAYFDYLQGDRKLSSASLHTSLDRIKAAAAEIARDGQTILDRFEQPKPHPLLGQLSAIADCNCFLR